MDSKVRALLVASPSSPLRELEFVLTTQHVETIRVEGCREFRSALSACLPLHLAFTDLTLPDGNWAEVVSLAGRLKPPIPVVVVSRFVDIGLYLTALETGAQDFMVPPFAAADVAYVVRGAILESMNPQRSAGAKVAIGPARSRAVSRTSSRRQPDGTCP